MGCANSKSGNNRQAQDHYRHANDNQNQNQGQNMQKPKNNTDFNINDFNNCFEQDNSPSSKNVRNKALEGETASKDDINIYYEMGEVQGIGSFGQVRIATSKQEKSRTYAIKTIKIEKLGSKTYMLKRELEILKALDHPNVIRFYQIFQEDQYIYFVMEYCEGGQLLEQVTDQTYFKEEVAAKMIYQIICALAHMHDKNVAHRDLKPENVLFSTKNNKSELKIIDFGLSRIFQPQQPEKNKFPSVVGTPLYVAPEVISETNYGKECDNWSIGVVTYFILCGKEPFLGTTIEEVYTKIKDANFTFKDTPWNTVSSEAKDFITRLLEKDPKLRMTARQALKHAWFKNHIKTTVPEKFELKKYDYIIKKILDNHQQKQIPKLKKEVITVLINHYLSELNMNTLKNTFKLFDFNKDGELSYFEIKTIMQNLDFKERDIEQMRDIFIQTRQMDTYEQENKQFNKLSDDELVIFESEFMRSAIDLQSYVKKKQTLESLFRFFSSKDYIDIEDIKGVVAREGRKLQERELEEMMAEVSMEKRGQISFELFKMLMCEEDIAKVQLSSVKMQKIKPTNIKPYIKK